MVRRQIFTSFFIVALSLFVTPSFCQDEPPHTITKAEELSDCEESMVASGIRNKTVYYGWPFALSCSEVGFDLIDGYMYYYDEEEDVYLTRNATCIVHGDDSELWRETNTLGYFDSALQPFVSSDVTEESPLIYKIYMKDENYCFYETVQVVKEQAPQDCGSLPPEMHNDFSIELGGEIKLVCYQPTKDRPELVGRNFTYTWFYNNTEINDKRISDDESIFLSDLQFEDGGRYECRVNYNGQTRSVIQHNVCLTYTASTTPEEFSVSCDEKYDAVIGEDLTIECVGDLGLGQVNGVYLTSTWLKKNSTSEEEDGEFVKYCENMVNGNMDNATSNPDAKCYMETTGVKMCFQYNPHLSQAPSESSIMQLSFRNFKKSDLGQYRLKLHYLGLSQHANFSIVAQYDGLRKSEIAAISACISFLVVVVVLLLLCMWRWHDVLWYCKKHFGEYEKESLPYTVYLAYFYSRESKMSNESRSNTEKLIDHFQEFMGKFGGSIYDDHKEFSPYIYQPDTLLRVQKDCHRIVIVLTKEYIEDEWSLHEAYQSLHTVIGRGDKVIFIVLPGAMDNLDDISVEAKRTLLSATKRNITLKWKGEEFGGKFKRRLEYALPKLPPPGYNRYLSSSSQAPLTRRKGPESPTSSEGFENGFSAVSI